MTRSLRWAFNVKDWKPTRDQWKLCVKCVQKEEMERCNRFCFVDDCKSSMIGRLLMRKAVNESLSVEYDKILFARSTSGKPFLIGENENNIFFNVSHHGDFCVLASELDFLIGIDVMKMEYKGKKPLAEYFQLMQKQFSSSEWDFIASPGFEKQQIERFFRLWCLKESFVKATGTGIAYDLQTLSFSCKTLDLKHDAVITDTELFKDGIHQKNWIFEETILNTNHCVAVAVGAKKGRDCCAKKNDSYNFEIINFEELMRNCRPFEKDDENAWEIFTSKSEKTMS